MKVLLQRVSHGSVSVNGQVIGSIRAGLVIFVGIRAGDTATDAGTLARKTAALRIFPDAQGRMNRALPDIGGEALVISQFTLYADTRKGCRPSFIHAGDPTAAEALYLHYIAELNNLIGPDRVQTGRFGASMQVGILNDGPVTIELCTDA